MWIKKLYKIIYLNVDWLEGVSFINELIKTDDFKRYYNNNKAKIYFILSEFYSELKEFESSLENYRKHAKYIADNVWSKYIKK